MSSNKDVQNDETNSPQQDNTFINSVISAQLERQNGLVASLYQRASILIGASGISTALLTREDLSIVWLFPIGLFIASIILAVISLSFQKGDTLRPATLLEKRSRHDEARFESNVLDGLARTYDSVNSSVQHRVKILGIAMSLFACGWVMSFMILLVLSISSL